MFEIIIRHHVPRLFRNGYSRLSFESSKLCIEDDGIGLFYVSIRFCSCAAGSCRFNAFKFILGRGSGVSMCYTLFDEALSDPKSLQLTWYESITAIFRASSAEANCP